jgi:hypothetical protein
MGLMSKSPKRKPEPILDEEPVFATFGASLRIFGENLELEEITQTLGLAPTHSHRKGECQSPGANPWSQDMWSYDAPIDGRRPLHEHFLALWEAIRPQIPYLRKLKSKHHVDVFCSYQGKIYPTRIKVDYGCLGLFTELEVPFAVSIVVS